MSSHRSDPARPFSPGVEPIQPYGDLVQLNTSREVLDSVGKEVLASIAEDYLELLGTSSAVYESNGDYALGIVSSGWCRFMDAASYRLCGKDDPREALASGKWNCHESCWSVSREAMQSRGDVDVACAGGIRLFGVPIIAAGEVVGSINFGYGDPPRHPERLAELAQKYEVSIDELKAKAESYESRTPEAIGMAKRRLRASAKLIGEIVARKRAEETLRESEHRFRFLADAVPQQIWATRPDGYHEYYNQRWHDYTGLTLEQTEGDGWNAVLHPDDQQRAWDRWRHSLATGEPYEIEYRFRRHDGAYKWFLGQALPQRNDQGEIVRWFGTLTDIHDRYESAKERERLLNAILESEERYTLVARATNDVIRDWDLTTDELVWNEALEPVFGYSPNAVPSHIEFWYDHVHPEDRERVVESIHAAIDAGESSWASEYRFARLDGSSATVLDRAFIARDGSGKPTRMIGSMLDISERECLLAAERRAREEAERAAQVTSLITTHLGDGICMMDAEGRLTYMNPAAERILGWTQAELQGQVLHDVVHYEYPDGRPFPMQECPLGRVLSAAEPVLNMADQWVHKDGSFVHLVTTCSPIVRAGGVVGAVLSMHDDTERRAVEAEREKLLQAEQAARADAESANQAKMDFLSAMSHELRTPLNAIGGYVDLLDLGIHGPVTQAQQTALGRVRASQQHLLTLINDVLAFAKLEAGRIEFALHPLSVSDVLASVEPLISPLAEAKGIALSVQEGEPCLQIVGDVERVRQVMLNLTANAIKFTPEGGWVALSCEADEEWVRIQVRDNGPGIEQEKQEKIFDPFIQADRRLNRPQDGVGLGLAISRDLARGMGGDITVESAPGRGSTFTVVLPRGTPDLNG